MRVFIDSDVVISSLISTTGAAHFLLNQSLIKPVITSISQAELQIVTKRLGIESEKLEQLVMKRFTVLEMDKEITEIKQEYEAYVTDINDAHIVAGAHSAKVKYIISYNLKHFKTDKINDKLDILLLTPALFLQYLRSH